MSVINKVRIFVIRSGRYFSSFPGASEQLPYHIFWAFREILISAALETPIRKKTLHNKKVK